MAPDARLRQSLDQVLLGVDRDSRLASDPVSIVRQLGDPASQELVGLMAACLAFGNVTTIRAKIRDALERLDGDPIEASKSPESLRKKLASWKHRLYKGEDLAGLILGAAAAQREHGSLGALFAAKVAEHVDLRPSLTAFVDEIRKQGWGADWSSTARTRGSQHILPDPAGSGGSKRLLLFLRWMVREDDGVDLGLWSKIFPASKLLIPIDTHMHRIALNVGLTARTTVNWETAEEVTRGLRAFDKDDPVKFDFPLCHMGIVQRCPSARDPVRCEGCGVQPVCIHWRSKPASRTSSKR